MSNGNGVFGRRFYFTVENKYLIPIIEEAMTEQKEVKIKYYKEYMVIPRRTTTKDNTFVDDIEIISK